MIEKNGIFASVDAGGTTFKCALSTYQGDILAQKRIPTTTPLNTLNECINFFSNSALRLGVKIQNLGIATFGPIDVDLNSRRYGTILNTPKPGWSGIDLKSTFEQQLGVPVAIDTDVNGALLAEIDNGTAKGCSSAVYVTIGTGIGAGVFANGDLIGKPFHPEFGHIRVERYPGDSFEGICGFHKNCLEGMASAKALTARSGTPENIHKDDPVWRTEANYLAQGCWSLSLSFRPERIILGGGLMLAPHLIDLVREEYLELSGDYLGQIPKDIEQLIVRPAYGDDAGLLGGLVLARNLTGL